MVLWKKNPGMKNSWKNGPCQNGRKNGILKIFATHKNVTVIFASNYRRIAPRKNGPRKNGQSIKIKKSFKFPFWKKNSWKNGPCQNGILEVLFNS